MSPGPWALNTVWTIVTILRLTSSLKLEPCLPCPKKKHGFYHCAYLTVLTAYLNLQSPTSTSTPFHSNTFLTATVPAAYIITPSSTPYRPLRLRPIMSTPAFGAQAGTQPEPNNAALYESRRRQTITGTQILDNIVSFSNCMSAHAVQESGE